MAFNFSTICLQYLSMIQHVSTQNENLRHNSTNLYFFEDNYYFFQLVPILIILTNILSHTRSEYNYSNYSYMYVVVSVVVLLL